MVDLFTGDASYNIPLLDVEGYPVNLFYNAGVGMDQEASWVGLGWNLNPGVVDRTMRGIPDDFRGDEVVRTMNIRPNRTYGANYGIGLQLFSAPVEGLVEEVGLGSLNLSAAPSFNNYGLFSWEIGVNFSMRSTRTNKSSFTAGLGITSNSNRGLRMQPTIGFDQAFEGSDYNAKAGLNFGLSIDSREGLSDISFGTSLDVSKNIKATEVDIARDSQGNAMHNSDGTYKTITSTKTIARSNAAPMQVGTSFPLGAPTYMPQVGLPMRNRSLSFSFTWGGAAQGAHPNMTLGGFYSEQKLISTVRNTPSYGYLNLDAGQLQSGAQLDFNREKDGPYSGDRAALGIAQLTNDVFSVSGQGVGGSYRAYRAEVGHVFDPSNSSGGSGGSGGLDVGAGLLAHGGARIMVNHSASNSGDWNANSNQAGQRLRYKSLANRPELERVYFREANEATVEQDSALWTAMRGAAPMRFTLPSNGQFDNRLGMDITNGSSIDNLPQTNHRAAREPRAQLFSYLDQATATDFGLEAPPTDAYRSAHHMSEITVLAKDGVRNIYGLAAYNTTQSDIEFNVDLNGSNVESPEVVNVATGDGLVSYTASDASTNNKKGRDRYFSSTVTPAYPYAFLLTAVLSSDYSDIDGIRGPSDADLGNYTKFNYKRLPGGLFQWRTPTTSIGPNGEKYARFMEGDPSNAFDDKATIVHGEKEVWHLDEIVTRNMIAIFHTNTDTRADARPVLPDGGIGSQHAARLDSISLYEKSSYLADPIAATPIKRVHFRYTNELCVGAANNGSGTGKLTLTKVWFTYGSSRMGVTSPYIFSYGQSAYNANYNFQHQDRWGNYKVAGVGGNENYPYAEQDQAIADLNAAQWALHTITLPSGGMITMKYEADDYGYVQDHQAMRMIEIMGISTSASLPSTDINMLVTGGNADASRDYLWYRVPDGLDAIADIELKERLFQGVDQLYYRVKVDLGVSGGGDWVSGYLEMEEQGFVVDQNIAKWGYIRVRRVPMDECSNCDFTHPIFRSAIEYLQLHYNDRLSTIPDFDGDQSPGESFFLSLLGSLGGFFTGFFDFFEGPNESVSNRDANFCESIVLGESWIRLNDPDFKKKGGGHRVKEVEFADGWAAMEGAEQDKAFTYTQHYTYGDENGSWGVAAYEPMMGADENPFRQPVFTTVTNALAPDQRFYLEEPFGEMLFPSPVVGYSKVVVEDVVPTAQRPTQGTGRVVHEFYTARDFPTIVSRTGLDAQRRSNNPNLMSLLGFKKIDHMHASQGFVVETNDMHGKPKRTTVYPEGSDQAVSYVAYHYGTEPMGEAQHLVNTETVIDAQGNIGRAEIGRDHEFVADTREFASRGISGGADVKFELLYAMIAAIPVPLVLPQISWESTKYKTGVLVKKVHRFGRLRQVEKMENGSVVTTENLAYDALTGDVLVTRTRNDFKDPIYSMTFPAYWHYQAMGPAYRNLGVRLQDLPVTAGANSSTFQHGQASSLFASGDELALVPTSGGSGVRAWVDAVQGTTVTITRQHLAAVAADTYDLTIVRSGYRNLQAASMMNLTSLSNPLDGLSGNVYQNLVNASVSEYGGDWATDCACLPDDPGTPPLNPWVLNQRGVWRMNKEHVYLTDRTRSVTNNNADIRRDGVYTSFDPFYKMLNGQWSIDPAGWTTSREVTHYSSRGHELENRDALGLYSSATFGYRGSLAKTVARNARYQENGFDGFEENTDPMHCADQHFRISAPTNAIVQDVGHTGRHSVRVQAGQTSIGFSTTPIDCPPAPPCALTLTIADDKVIVSGASGTFTVTPQVSQGQFSFTPNATGISFAPPPPSPWSVTFTVTDAAGCTATQTVSSPAH